MNRQNQDIPMLTDLVLIQGDQLRQLVTDAVQSAIAKTQREAAEAAQQASQQNELLTKKETAELLKVSIATVDNYVRDGLLTKMKMGLRAVRFNRAEVEKLAIAR